MAKKKNAHAQAGKKNRFCCTRGKPCKCESPNNYRTNCAPSPMWKVAKTNEAYAAHHILCKASVQQCIAARKGMEVVVKQTRWCVNKPENMIALPLWGHTVKWYHKNDDAPPFCDLPQHDWDHNGADSYQEEVEESLNALAMNLQKAKGKHDADGLKELRDGLDARSRKFRKKLRDRGSRQGKTHRQFSDKTRKKRWWEPFSMAGFASQKGYPTQNWRDLVKEKVKNFFG
jgi:hypothetical protein